MTELERPLMPTAPWPWTHGPVVLVLGRAVVRWLRRLRQWRPPHGVPPRRTLLQRELERLEQRKAQLPWGPYL